jgi:hypothetical protein
MPKQLTKIDKFAQKLIEELPPDKRPYPGELTYVVTGARLIHQKLQKFYCGTGAEPPKLNTIRNWFYIECPAWAIAVLHHAIYQQKMSLK